MSSIAVLGSTGQVGRHALLCALSSPEIASVHSFGRSPPSNVSSTTPGFSKLQHVTFDYEALLKGDAGEAAKLAGVGADSLVIAHGTTRAKAGGPEPFRRIDQEYVVAAAKAAKVAGKDQAIVYCSSAGTSSSSSFLYPQSKGQTEERLADLGYSRTTILHPAYLITDGARPERRLAETIFGSIVTKVAIFSDAVCVPVQAVGAMMIRAATSSQDALSQKGWGSEVDLKGHKAWSINNKQILDAFKGK